MRHWFVFLCLIGLTSGAFAADYELPTLRGSSTFVPGVPKYARWDGLYVGGQAGYSFTKPDLTDAFDSTNIFDQTNLFSAPLGSVSGWAVFGKTYPRGVSYGGFVGYNAQFDDALVGLEINYNHSSLQGKSTDSRCHSSTDPNCFGPVTLGDNNAYNATIEATASTRITDFATFRGRGGWVYRDLLAYAMVGVAVARVESLRSATATGAPVNPGPSPFTITETAQRTYYTWGYMAGVGVDYLLTSTIFLRGEYEFVQLNPVADIRLNINTVRGALGIRF